MLPLRGYYAKHFSIADLKKIILAAQDRMARCETDEAYLEECHIEQEAMAAIHMRWQQDQEGN